MYGLAGQMQGPFFDDAGNPMPAGTTVTCDPLSGNCVEVPGITTPSDVSLQQNLQTTLATASPTPSVTNPLGSPTAQAGQSTLLWAVAGIAGFVLLLKMSGSGR